MKRLKTGIVGARGYVGRELMEICANHPQLDLAYVASRADAGKPARDMAPSVDDNLYFVAPTPEDAAAAGLDVCVLALPNGLCHDYETAFNAINPDCLLIDLSADKRAPEDAGHDWVYSIPELDRHRLHGAKRISNPGCYATAAQLALAPFKGMFADTPRVFGISGYSGAGTTPSRKNDPEVLHNNIIPYGLTGHIHEGEMTRRAGQEVDFTPHVAEFFRGISVTVDLRLKKRMNLDDVKSLFVQAYGHEKLIKLTDVPPEIPHVTHTAECHIGGWAIGADGKRVVVVCVIDNLLKGAASQAMQNINAALGLDERAGLPQPPTHIDLGTTPQR